MKKKYAQPRVEVTSIFTEEGIAAGSARVFPQNSDGYVQDSWEQESDDNRNIDW